MPDDHADHPRALGLAVRRADEVAVAGGIAPVLPPVADADRDRGVELVDLGDVDGARPVAAAGCGGDPRDAATREYADVAAERELERGLDREHRGIVDGAGRARR